MVRASQANKPDAVQDYDALGNRVAEKVNDVWQFVIYDAFGKLVAEYGGNPQQDEGGVMYYLQDWQGSVRACVNAGGYVRSRTDHQAFGEDIESGIGLRSTAQGFGAPQTNRQGYGLTEKDSATGMGHTWFRKNENRAGRWTSPDPYNGSASVGSPQSWNRYSYVESQPTNFVDPSGLRRMECGFRNYYTTVCIDGDCEISEIHTEFVCWWVEDVGTREPMIGSRGGGHHGKMRIKDTPSIKTNDCSELEPNIVAILDKLLFRLGEYFKFNDGDHYQAVDDARRQLQNQLNRWNRLGCASNNPRIAEAKEKAAEKIPDLRKPPTFVYTPPRPAPATRGLPVPVWAPSPLFFVTPLICILCNDDVLIKIGAKRIEG